LHFGGAKNHITESPLAGEFVKGLFRIREERGEQFIF
jgi:hypothetical protein